MLGFLEAARYIVVALPVVVAEKRADILPVPSGADPFASSSVDMIDNILRLLSYSISDK